jgi:hypothetical protein
MQLGRGRAGDGHSMRKGAEGKSIAAMISIGCLRAGHHRNGNCIRASSVRDPIREIKFAEQIHRCDRMSVLNKLLKRAITSTCRIEI